MPLIIFVPGKEMFDPKASEFITVKPATLSLEHSLISLSKWEAKWHKPYLSREEKTHEEVIDYVRCMTLNGSVDPNVYRILTKDNIDKIAKYIQDPMTATTIKREGHKASREIVTSELIYYWMTALNIPFEPCQKWHLNRLMTLIEVCSIKNAPPKKMSRSAALKRQHALNAQRRSKYHTSG